MNYSDLVLIAVAGPVIALAVGYVLGGRHADAYWADHGDGELVHHKGDFYRVEKQKRQALRTSSRFGS